MEEEYKRVTFSYGIVMLRTKWGLQLMDRLGKWKTTRPFAWVMLGLLPVSGGLALFLILEELSIYLSPKGAEVASYVRTITPAANLLLPGINPYVPIVYGLIGIIVAVTIHELCHGIVARSLGLRVKTAGLVFFLVIPIGAFVEIDEKELRETRARNSIRVLAAGSGINFIIGIVCLILLVLSASAMVPIANGTAVVGVDQGTSSSPSPAWSAGLRPGDIIVAVNGVSNNDIAAMNLQPYQVISITYWHDGEIYTATNVKLGEIIVENTQTHQNTTEPYLGINYLTYQQLQSIVSGYVNLYSRSSIGIVLYAIPPAFPGVQGSIPFSDELKAFYTSPLGGATNAVQNVLFWVFFVNFNLAIFNNLPIYPMDGGQSLERFLVGVGRGRISDATSRRLTTGITVLLLVLLLSVVIGPYLGAFG